MVCRAALQTRAPRRGAGGAWSLGDNAINAQLGACQVLAAVLRQSQNENPAEGLSCGGFCPGAGSRDSGVGDTKGYVRRAPLRKLTGVPKGSSRNVRHEQPIRHALLEMSDHCAVIRFLPPITISCAIASSYSTKL